MQALAVFIPRSFLTRRRLSGLLAAWLLLIASTVFAAPGDLDPTFRHWRQGHHRIRWRSPCP
ncbi:MAG: hypothetical protein M5R38_00835 [Candidatus Methylomirabilis sp.]|nr:hypothetical protein [Candidatus Methylomirabilis sp.]